MIQSAAIKAGNANSWLAKEEDIQEVRNLLTETAKAEAEAMAEWSRLKQALYVADRAVKEAESARTNVQVYLIGALTELAGQEVRAAREAAQQ